MSIRDEASYAAKADKIIDKMFGVKPTHAYAIYKDHPKYPGQYAVIETKEEDGKAVETGKVWLAPDIFVARGHVPVANRVQVHADVEHDLSSLVETWV